MSAVWIGLFLYAAMTLATVAAVLFVTAPYGRHTSSGWGPELPARWGWVLMECPFRVRGRPMPLSIAAMGFGFNVFNAWINGTWIASMGDYPLGWATDPRFIIGLVLFLGGLVIHLRSDAILRGLRAPGETGYRIPRGFLYRWVSCPNYLGESVQWLGWALLTFSPSGLLFGLYTLANLGPRALSHHRWYQERFADYPASRRAWIPFVI